MKLTKSAPAIRALATRLGLVLVLLGSITLIADSQPPPLGAADQAPPVRLPPSGSPAAVAGPDFPDVAAAGDMIGFSHADAGGTQTITLVHTKKSWMAVYHIDKSGSLRLVSSRPIDADFSLQLNATSPLPEEIRQIGRR